jgi:hypothetical protein
MNKHGTDLITFFMGMLMGAMIFAQILGLCKQTKYDGIFQVQNEAVKNGSGKWVVDFSKCQPIVRFEWNK